MQRSEEPDAGTRRQVLEFASCYVYAPRGEGLISAGSRQLCQRLKECDPLWLPHYAGAVVDQLLRYGRFVRLLKRDALLVPVPGSTQSGEARWPAWQLARALQELGPTRGVWVGLQRRFPVRKSATALTGERPTVYEHYESFAASRNAHADRIVLIDDVITKGRTLFAAAARLRDRHPSSDIGAFALVRTLGFSTRVDRVLAPCEGVVRWGGGDVRREP